MSKSGQSRFNDTVQYLHSRVDSNLAVHLQDVVRRGNVTGPALGAELSIGTRYEWPWGGSYDDNTQQRRALRALLLCQRVYLSKLWCEVEIPPGLASGSDTSSFVKTDAFASWDQVRQTTMSYWGGRNESEIVKAIRLYTATSGTAADAADAATSKGDFAVALPFLKLTRDDPNFPGHQTCYSAVMFWLFKSGLVSYRWMLKHSMGQLDVSGLKRAFGDGKDIWKADKAFDDKSTLPKVPRGHVVHLYVDNSMQWKGHWLISDGAGGAYGCNNDDEDGRVAREYALCNLNRQFLAYKGYPEGTDERNRVVVLKDKGVLKGVATVFDPLEIPDRL